MSDKCMNEGCANYHDWLRDGGCGLSKRCGSFTTTPTTSIPTAELEELKRRGSGIFCEICPFVDDEEPLHTIDKLHTQLTTLTQQLTEKEELLREAVRLLDQLHSCWKENSPLYNKYEEDKDKFEAKIGRGVT